MTTGWIIGTVIIIVILFLIIKAKRNYKKYSSYQTSGSGVKGFLNACCGRGKY